MGATTIDLTFFLSRCEREFTPTEIVLTAADNFHAEGLRRCCVELAKWALAKERDVVIVRWAGDGGNPYRIPTWYASLESSTPNANESGATPIDISENAQNGLYQCFEMFNSYLASQVIQRFH
jgi:hypothetical protein